MTPDEMVSAAIEVAEEGLAAGELPIGAVVVMGNEIVGRAFTQDSARKRRLVHADLLAMIEADELLGWTTTPAAARGEPGAVPDVLGRCDGPGCH